MFGKKDTKDNLSFEDIYQEMMRRKSKGGNVSNHLLDCSSDVNDQDDSSFDEIYQKIMRRKYRISEVPNDLLKRSSDINDICRIIKQKANDKDYFSMALTGEWGSGKSFVLTRVEKKLSGEFITIHYDCWENDFYDEPLYGILYSLVQFFNREDNPDFAQSKYYKAMRKVIFGIVRLTPLVNLISKELVSVVSETIADVKKNIAEEFIDSNIDSFQKDIHSILDQICAAFVTYILLEKRKLSSQLMNLIGACLRMRSKC